MQTSFPAETQILVCGAGPTGLAAAISLICNGIDPSKLTIIGGEEKSANTSRAIAIHAATLEALDAYGCASKLIELGIKGTSFSLSDKKFRIFQSDFKYIAPYTRFPFVLLLSQTVTEHVLEERLNDLGARVLRPCRVVGMTENTERGMDVLFQSGEIVRADYVIGADGAKSTVRQLSGIHFRDHDGQPLAESVRDRFAQMIVADVSFSAEVGHDAGVSITASEDGMFLLLPLGKSKVGEMLYNSRETVYRIVSNIPRNMGEPPSHPSLEYIQTNLNQQGPLRLSSDLRVNPNPVHITQVHWSSRFRTHSAIADVFFKRVHGGLVFLVGDAAHIHAPVGGQGMNLGLRDALYLGSVLADHIRKREEGKTDENNITELANFAATRRNRGLGVIRLTKFIVRALNFVVEPHIFRWPVLILRLLSYLPFFKSRIVYTLSGLGNK